MDAELTLQKFTLRARRIAAHSLAADRGQLAEMASSMMVVNVNLDGETEFRRELPNEEAFESLAARVRPVLLNSESVHHQKVLKALEIILEKPAKDTEDLEAIRTVFQQLRVAWSRYDELNPALHRYAIQRAKNDGTEATPQVSDSQLALAWLYGDLVHVDVKGKKLDGTLLPIKERYAAAVSYFSGVALLCAQTFDVITDLARRELLKLDDDVMDVPVVVGSDDLVSTGVAYVAPVGTPMPDLTESIRGTLEGFNRFTVTEWLRMNPKNHVEVRLEDANGNLVAQYDAAVSDRHEEGGFLVWKALVAGCVEFELTFKASGEKIENVDLRANFAKPSTNRMALDKARFERDAYYCSSMWFIVSGRDFFKLAPSKPTEDDMLANAIIIDSMGDLVTIEGITGQEVPLPGDEIIDLQRAELRRVRLLWEGHVVPFARGPLPTTVATGVVPQGLIVPAGTRAFAGTQYPSPQFVVRHPRMVAGNVEPVTGSEPPQDSMQMAVPGDEPFVAWVPGRATVESDADLVQPTPWGLSHFDTSRILGSQWTDGQRLTL